MRHILAGILKNGNGYDEVMNVETTGVCIVKEMQGDFEIHGLYEDKPKSVPYDAMVKFFESDVYHAGAIGIVFSESGYWVITEDDEAHFYEYMETVPAKSISVSLDVEYDGEDDDEEDDGGFDDED